MHNPFHTMSPRAVRILYTLAAVVVLAVSTEVFVRVMFYQVVTNDQCAWLTLPAGTRGLLITGVVKGGVTDRAGVVDGDTLLKINRIAFADSRQAQRIIDSLNAGDTAIYTVKRGTEVFETRVEMGKTFNVQFLSVFLLGLGFLVVGFVVVMTKPEGSIQRKFGRYGMLTLFVFALLTPSIDPARDPLWRVILYSGSFVIGRILGPPVFVSFFFHFPVRRKILNHRWVVPLLYVLSTALAALAILLARLQLGILPLLLTVYSPILFFLAGLIIFAHSYFKQVEPRRRPQLRPILLAVLLGVASFLYIFIMAAVNPFAIFLQPFLLSPAILLVLVPQAFGYAIFRYRLMDIDLVVKRSLIYGMVTTALAAIYLLCVFGLGTLLNLLLGYSDNRMLNVLAVVVIAFVFDPIKRRVQESIDRIFYRERHDYQKALLEFSQELPRQMNLDQILSSVAHRISATMHVEKIAVIICDEAGGCSCLAENIPAHYCTFAESHAGLLSLLRETKKPISFALLAEEPDSVVLNSEDKTMILQAGVVLSVPMFLQERLIGTINVGPKKSGKVYSQEDVDLLSTVAGQAAIAIENARLHRSEIEKQKIEEELALARRIQQGLLPKSEPKIEGLDIAGISIPALVVGGDYYDYIRLAPRKLLVVVADVSGKGMSASLYMSKVQGMVQLAAQMYSSPREILIHVNRRLYEGMERSSFITMIIALFDLDAGEVRICRAGHHKALIRTNGTLDALDAKGIGLGLERGPLFEKELEEVRRPLGGGGTFVFYSDGVSETMNERRSEFGEEAMREVIERRPWRSSHELQESMLAALREFRGSAEQHDDITLVIVNSH